MLNLVLDRFISLVLFVVDPEHLSDWTRAKGILHGGYGHSSTTVRFS